MNRIPITFSLNGEDVDIYVNPNRTLLEVLREDLELTGTKEGCGEGVCGSCTVLWNGSPIRGCLTLAAEARGAEITTVEGLRRSDGTLDPLQQAFIDHGAIQCGFCTPGMLMAARAFLNRRPIPDDAAVREAIGGNICRCTGYAKIVEAIMAAAGKDPEEVQKGAQP
jgi:aerobic carbon-monoxide dehydrogenase small subunit